MEFHHLRYFVAVAEELHFGRAAQRLHITQPALSKQIRSLEAELGLQLFSRTQRRVQLTRAGLVFLEQARQLLHQADAALQLARRTARGETGQLSLGFTASALQSVLPRIVRVFRERYPAVELSMTELCTEDQVEALLGHRVDVAFLHPPMRSPAVQLQPLGEENFVAVFAEDHPLLACGRISLRALADEAFIIHPRQEGPVLYDQFFELCARMGFRPKVVREVTTHQNRIGLVAAGMGITFLPESLQGQAGAGVACRPLADAAARLVLAAAWHQDNTSPILGHFLTVAKAVADL
ncbi:LysR family transcriptional regulator [Gloeobacter violaceus]|uniref:LysR family transcriptional regulatory protein n=1 Tax=Gloeobacter violaceus (strain ATCC 29082 / PCC 7421) TaxID=251221 RepID=Q7NCJ3_GLOVI|nr:LysR family transcriptional regulator [Gloeobacter violaceus]BAC90927.1 LysR family transcriptional regulatory protein [Gloeobacter violaceus PCC 7421]